MGSKRIRYKIKVALYAVCFVLFYRQIFEPVFTNSKSASESNASKHLCTTVDSYQQVKEQLPCEWTDTGLWGQPTDESNNKSLLQVAEEHAHHLFAGKSGVLVIGGSMSRDLAADFMHA
eukprot:scaffold254573_cov54-Attheya_sp.AAC.1